MRQEIVNQQPKFGAPVIIAKVWDGFFVHCKSFPIDERVKAEHWLADKRAEIIARGLQ